MKHKSNSPFAVEQSQISAHIYSHDAPSKPTGWRCSSRIPVDIALNIYRSNLHGGVAQHLQTHFPIAHAYIGEHAYHAICAEYLKASPPKHPIFTLYAAHFPGFLVEYGEQHPEQVIWTVAAHLMQIDFFHHNAFREDQRIDVDQRYYQLWINTKSIVDNEVPINSEGLYQRVNLHPEVCLQQESQAITLATFWENGVLYFRVEQTDSNDANG